MAKDGWHLNLEEVNGCGTIREQFRHFDPQVKSLTNLTDPLMLSVGFKGVFSIVQ